MTRSSRLTLASRRGWKSLAWCLTAGLSMVSASALAQKGEEPVEDPRLYSEKVLEEGEGYQLKYISGYTADDKEPQFYEREFYTLSSPEGLKYVRMPAAMREEITAAFEESRAESKENEGAAFSIDKRVVDELVVSEERGELTPYLKEVLAKQEAEGEKGAERSGMGRMGSCSDQMVSRSKSFSFSTPINLSTNPGGTFNGSITSTGNMSGSATGQVTIAIKRFRFFGCIPYAARFDNARAWGNASVGSNSSINGSASAYFSKDWQLAKPHLGSINFAIGPVPVHIGFNLPINLGVVINASASGSVAYTGQQTATGNFDYTCTSLSNCTGYANYSLGNSSTPQPATGSVTGRIQPAIWAQVAVRAYLYTEWLAHAQVGVRPYLYGDLWGYYGNQCGDADGNGVNETVRALTFNLDWQLFLTAKASFVGRDREWNNLWSTSRRHIKFWDLIKGGSSALQPLLLGPSSTPVNVTTNYTTRMRPCWPYGDSINGQFNWGDASTTSFTAPPFANTIRGHAWSAAGAKTVQAIALSDTWGRNLGSATTARTVQVTSNPTWTPWFNRDAPGGVGDYETLSDLRNEGYAVCANPVGIECQTTNGVNWSSTGQSYTCNVSTGGVCVNSSSQYCLDYRVRFLCP